ncbi:hypothetical protein E1B28_012386 [Marasmius oreades]|uniref:Acyl-CoA dehydrogenase n=1 Tax=Marasmius oreades TaxID=181124 RepID=A0A9P7UNW7_9AGAR|nr:uncharacterized protein E1B28_012386 [Marasmius oreades]KAG7088385.1 hypothetical protein E1B28_012386 [Marasmius oreades]
MRVEDGFQPIPYLEQNPYTTDLVISSLLRRLVPEQTLASFEPDLVRFGDEVITTIRETGAPHRVTAPELVQYDQWGKRIDRLQTSQGWIDLKAAAQREGIPAIFYERKYNEYSRLYGFAKAFLMVGYSHVVFCPLSMTDGAARIIELLGTPGMREHLLPRLVSRDTSFAFVSGQWMTERSGGSDVSQTETIAQPMGDNHVLGPRYLLHGFKWFSSATDSDISMALARTGSLEEGSRGLSLFLIPLRRPLLRDPAKPTPSPTSNGIRVHRLKNKIGTHTLPTAELSLEETEGYLVGKLGQGVRSITPILNITRVWSALGSVGALRRCLSISTAFAEVRTIDGGKTLLKNVPLHVAQLAKISTTYRALAHLTFEVVRLLGKSECNTASQAEKARLRLLTPLVKAFCAELAVASMEEAMTTLGGAGYMEENDMGRLIRDSLVEKIWEGTTTVLSLDLIRASRDPSTLQAYFEWAEAVVASCPPQFKDLPQLQLLVSGLNHLSSTYENPIPTLMPRPALMLMGYTTSSLLLLEHTIWSSTTMQPERETDITVLCRWIEEGGLSSAIEDVKRVEKNSRNREIEDSAIVFGRAVNPKL